MVPPWRWGATAASWASAEAASWAALRLLDLTAPGFTVGPFGGTFRGMAQWASGCVTSASSCVECLARLA